jgi:hypothetical protein
MYSGGEDSVQQLKANNMLIQTNTNLFKPTNCNINKTRPSRIKIATYLDKLLE